MQDFVKNLAALVKVKTLVTLVVIGVFAALALSGALQPDVVMSVAGGRSCEGAFGSAGGCSFAGAFGRVTEEISL